MNTFDDLKRVLNSIKQCTRPCKGHTDPKSVNDCWLYVNDIIEEIEKGYKIKIDSALNEASEVCIYGYQSLNKDAVLKLKDKYI